MTSRIAGTSADLPAPAGPYSPSVRIGDLIAVAGQVGIDPGSGQLVPGGVAAQVEQAFRNVSACLRASGAGLDDVIRVDVYLTEVADFAAMNEVYAQFFAEPYPARTTVYVGLPPDIKAEITVLAVKPRG